MNGATCVLLLCLSSKQRTVTGASQASYEEKKKMVQGDAISRPRHFPYLYLDGLKPPVPPPHTISTNAGSRILEVACIHVFRYPCGWMSYAWSRRIKSCRDRQPRCACFVMHSALTRYRCRGGTFWTRTADMSEAQIVYPRTRTPPCLFRPLSLMSY